MATSQALSVETPMVVAFTAMVSRAMVERRSGSVTHQIHAWV